MLYHADRLAHTVDINTGSCALGVFAFAEMGYTAGKLNDIQATLNVAVGVGYYFAVFCSDQGRQLISIGLTFVQLNSTRARRCGFMLLHLPRALAALCTAVSTSAGVARVTEPLTQPKDGL